MAGRGRIRAADIALVRERSRIDEVVGEHLQLKRAGGGSLKGLCPFHDEKSPSFQVTPSRGLYHCLAGETGVLTEDGTVVLNEVNTLPGLTSYSRYPRMMAAAGLPLADVLDRILSAASSPSAGGPR